MRELTRRGFLDWTATGAAALLLPTIVRPKTTAKVFDMGRRRSLAHIKDIWIYTHTTGSPRWSAEWTESDGSRWRRGSKGSRIMIGVREGATRIG